MREPITSLTHSRSRRVARLTVERLVSSRKIDEDWINGINNSIDSLCLLCLVYALDLFTAKHSRYRNTFIHSDVQLRKREEEEIETGIEDTQRD